jgi:MFS family permease
VQFLPLAAFMLVAGQVADRYDRRRLLQLWQTVEGLAALALALGSVSGWVSKEFILAAVFVLGTGRAFEQPTQQTLLPGVVPMELFPRAVAAAASTTQLATICGPALGGLLYAIHPTVPYGVACALYVTSMLLLAFVRTERRAAARTPVNFAAFFAGISYIRRNPIVLGAISLDLFAVLFGGATALLPIFAKEVFHVGPQGLGILRAAPAVGALLVAVALTHRPITRRVGRIMFASVTTFGVATIAFGLSESFALSLLALAVLGASDSVSVVIRVTLVQLETPDEMRGRVNAVSMLFSGTSNQLGDFRAGAMAAWLGIVPAVLVGGIGILAVVAMWTRFFPALGRVDTFQAAKT